MMNDATWTMLFFAIVKFLLVVAVAQIITYVWTQKLWYTYVKSLLPSPDPLFSRDIKRVFFILFTAWGWPAYHDELCSMRDSSLITQRGLEFGISKSSFSWIVGGLFTSFVIINMVSMGFFTDWSVLLGAGAEQPPAWLFYLSNDSAWGLLACWALGYFLSLFTGFTWTFLIFAVMLLGQFLTSVIGSELVVVGGAMGLLSRAAARHEFELRQVLFLRFVIMGLMALVLTPFLKSFLPFLSFSLDLGSINQSRYLLWLIAVALFLAMDTIVAAVFFHFRYQHRQKLKVRNELRMQSRRRWKT